MEAHPLLVKGQPAFAHIKEVIIAIQGNAGAKLGQIYIIHHLHISFCLKSSFFSVRQTNTDNALKYLNAAFQILRIYFRILSVRLVPFIFSCPSTYIWDLATDD